MPEPIRCVIVDDEAAIRRFLRASLGSEDIECFEATTGEEAIHVVAQKNPDIVLLDIGLPDIDGLDVLGRLREWTQVPVIMISARGQEKDKIVALDSGADDYVTKPFSVNELMARVRVALRHSSAKLVAPSSTFEMDGLRVDFERRQVFLGDHEVRLTPIEYRLLALLTQHAGKVLTHRFLIETVWGPAFDESTHTLRVHMGSVRTKIEADPTHPQFIRTETGVGYRFMTPP